jgi:restriction system protein
VGSITSSIRNFLDTIIDIVGIKSGLVLSRREVLDILKTSDADFDLADNELDGFMRICSETYEEHIRYVRVKIGNLNAENAGPWSWVNKLRKLDEAGVDPMSVIQALSEASRKFAHQRVDPEVLAKEIKKRVPSASYKLIFTVILIWAEHQFESHSISTPEQEEWDGGTPLEQLFNCEINSEEGFMDQKFLDYIATNTEKIQVMHWRNFERFCAEFFERLGYQIQLGPGGNDGGIDIRAFDLQDGTKPLIIIQCKRYKEGRQVGIETVKAFYTDVTFEQAQLGMIITTSEIAPGGKKVCEARKYPLSFAELEDVKKWAKMMSKHE